MQRFDTPFARPLCFVTVLSALIGCGADGSDAGLAPESGTGGQFAAGNGGQMAGSSGGAGAGLGGRGPSPSGPGGATGSANGGAFVAGGTTAAGGSNGVAGAAPGDGGSPGDGGMMGGGGSVASGGTSGTGGAGAGGMSGSCPDGLVGWATVSGDGVSTTTGGGNVAPVRPATADELMGYASDSSPRVIEIAGTFDVPRLQVNSNKTLIGIGGGATINGGVRIRGSSGSPVSNVIVKNLRVNGATTSVDNDAMQIYFAHHVWVDHSEIWDGPDGNLDMTHAINWVTVSWTKFRYTSSYRRPAGESSDHRFSSLIGHSDDNADEDTGRLRVSFHHDWWAEGVIERMPRVRFGQVHVFNNYFSSADNNYCVRAGRNASLLIEGNYFDGVQSPHEFNSTDDEATAFITARDNRYAGTSDNGSTGGGGTPFDQAPYSVTIESADGIPAIVRACAGPR